MPTRRSAAAAAAAQEEEEEEEEEEEIPVPKSVSREPIDETLSVEVTTPFRTKHARRHSNAIAGPQLAAIHRAAASQGRAARQHADPQGRRARHEQERNRVCQLPHITVSTPLPQS
jgi:fructosamine-3-kinase